jgi:hypothetical protein
MSDIRRVFILSVLKIYSKIFEIILLLMNLGIENLFFDSNSKIVIIRYLSILALVIDC